MILSSLFQRWFSPCDQGCPDAAKEERLEKVLDKTVEKRQQTVQDIMNLAALDTGLTSIFAPPRRRQTR